VRASSFAARDVQTDSSTVERVGWWERRPKRRRLAGQDRLSAHIAELMRIRELVGAAREVVAAGWVQDAWYVRPDEHGRHHSIGYLRGNLGGGPVARACLVGAILHANGGVATADTQVVQRAFDLAWHTLNRGEREPVRWCPAPPIRAQQLLDLVSWNDRPGRTGAEVEALLIAAERTADREVARSRQQLTALVWGGTGGGDDEPRRANAE
jgi:hypothetical protein